MDNTAYLTSQTLYPEEWNDRIFNDPPYSEGRGARRVLNADDSFGRSGGLFTVRERGGRLQERRRQAAAPVARRTGGGCGPPPPRCNGQPLDPDIVQHLQLSADAGIVGSLMESSRDSFR